MKDVVVTDACVLYPFYVRDLVLRLGERSLFRLYWSPQIENEWMNSLRQDRPDIPNEALLRLRGAMNRAYPEACVGTFPSVTASLPDPNDLHVLSLAVAIKATWIVTFNLKDFPHSTLSGYKVSAIHPDIWIRMLLQKFPHDAKVVFTSWLEALKSPRLSPTELLHCLTKNGLPRTAQFLENEGYSS